MPKGTSYVKPLIICGPSGAGKSTLYEELKVYYAEKLQFSVSCTTRKPRQGEENGVHYHFITIEKFKEELKKELFLEHAEVHGNFYGTHLDNVEKALEN